MHGENQDGFARVRHVPIKVESRDNRNTKPKQSGENNRGYQGEENLNQNPYHRSNQGSNLDQGSPNTSSININYKPPPPARTQPTHQNHYASGNHHHNSSTPNQQSNWQSERANNHEGDHSRGRSPNIQQSSPSNSDKLVSSPEPIPLPPPPSEKYSATCDTHTSQDQSSKNTEQAENKTNSHQGNQAADQNQPEMEEGCSVKNAINNVKQDVTNLLQEITKFDGISSQSKDYRYLDEMLTRCVLNLDRIECGDSAELRQQRKAAIKLVDRATDILQRKLQLNSDIHHLSENMATS